ncbi:MAG: RNA polymerase sigma factor [Oscillospiraceae bacterium]|nr:RNA polymerase sigma factor [Oscillospiraceae bacterium]
MTDLFAETDRENRQGRTGPLRLEKAEREFVHALYLDHYPALRSYAAGLGFRGEAAEDLLQETFLAAIRRISALQECENPRAYLMQILRNMVGYQLRSMKYAAGLAEKLRDRSPEEHRDELSPELLYRGLIGDEELRLLLRFYVDGLSQKELAEELGIDLGACKMRLKRARERLRAALEREKEKGGEDHG